MEEQQQDGRLLHKKLIFYQTDGGYVVHVSNADDVHSEWTSCYGKSSQPCYFTIDEPTDDHRYNVQMFIDHTQTTGHNGKPSTCSISGRFECTLDEKRFITCVVSDRTWSGTRSAGCTAVGVTIRRTNDNEMVAKTGMMLDELTWTQLTIQQIKRSESMMCIC